MKTKNSPENFRLQFNINPLVKLFLILLALTFCSLSYSASIIDSEFELLLSKQFQKKLLEEEWKSIEGQQLTQAFDFSDQVIETADGIKIQLKGINLKINSFLEKPELLQNSLLLNSKSLQAQISISQVAIDQVITRTIGGVTGSFRIEAQCNNVNMNLPSGQGQLSLTLKPSFQVETSTGIESLGLDVQDVSLSWRPSSWSIGEFQCTNTTNGFADVIRKQIQTISDESSAFINPRKMEILAVIKNAFLKYKFPLPKDQKWLESRSDIKFSMSIDQYVENSEGLIGKGRLILEFLNSKSNDVKKLSLSGELGQAISSEQQNLNMALIRLPELFIQEVFLKAYEENTWLHRVSSKKISGLNSLMNSRFMQFFNWRELMKYPKSSEFYLDLYSNQNPFIKGQGLQFQVQEDLLTKMYAPRAGAYIPFMNFETPLSMNINIAAQQGFLLVHFKKPIMKFKYSWDINYLKKYRPSTYFNSEVMKESIVNSLSSTNYKFRLPTIPLMEGTFLKVHKIEAPNRKDIFLNLAP